LWREEFDLAHAFFPADAWAAALAHRRLGGPPFVFSLHGIPIREYLVKRRYRLDLLLSSTAEAAVTTVLSEAAVEPMRRYLLTEPVVLRGGVGVEEFGVEERRAEAPTLLCAASLRDPRKRGRLLLDAFRLLRDRRRDAQLLLVRTPDPHAGEELPDLPLGARWVEAADTRELAQLYGAAWASVLPSVQEAFGLVLVESLAAGTPVVAARSGACPEIVDDPAIGRLFEPDAADDLARAMEEALELSRASATSSACRAQARRFGLPEALDRCEQVYRLAIGAAAGGGQSVPASPLLR
jgi:phosphatidyl-myo-inositol alpha-mannosyltransferase